MAVRIDRSTIVRLLLSAAASLLLIGALLQLAARGGGDAGPARLFAAIRNASAALIAAYAAVQLAQALCRAARYRVLLRGSGEPSVPSFGQVFLVTLARGMFVDLLPARAGELSYITLLNRGCRVSGEACVSSLAISLLFDFLALLLVLAAALPAATGRGPLLAAGAALVVAVAVGWAVLFHGLDAAIRLADRLAPWWRRWTPGARAMAFAGRTAESLRRVRGSGALGRALLLSVGVRAAKYGSLYLLFLGVARGAWPDLAAASPAAVLVALIAAEAAAALPLPSFMSFGTYEAGGLFALVALGFSREDSTMAMLAMHMVSQAIDYSLGGGALVLFTWLAGRRARAGESAADGATAPATPAAPARRRPAALSAAVLLAVAIAAALFAAWQWRGLRKLGALAPPGKGEAVALPAGEEASARERRRGLRGTLVWSSNRHGQHEILAMSLPDGDVRRLTSNPHADTFPRLSPDGRRVVFCRSQVEWVSQRDPRPWDVYVVEADGRNERLVARNGNQPGWSRDGRRVRFQRDGSAFVERDLETGAETVLFESGRAPVPDGVQLQTPDYDEAGGRLAVTYRGSRRATVIVGPGATETPVGGGCQLVWSPDAAFALYVDRGGKMKNCIWRFDPASGAREAWLDLPEPYSHEYFPRLSNDGRWMVLGACAEGHEHDTADYEIFLWRVGAPPEEAVRLTWHTGNDGWPDLRVD
jgi:hypothetical protein